MNVKYKLLKNGAIAPTYGTNGSACFDLYMCEDHVFPQGEWDTVSLGIAFEVPKGHVMKMYPRSSTCNRGLRLSNSVGVIDSDYRGAVHVAMDNITDHDVLIRAGERIV